MKKEYFLIITESKQNWSIYDIDLFYTIYIENNKDFWDSVK